MPDTRAAATAGELSLAQATELAMTEAECPGEAALLPLAKTESLRSLKDRARKARLGAIDPDDLHRRQAKRDGRHEDRQAHAADAFLKLVNGAGQGKANSADLMIVCDVRALRRGHAHPGEPVHLVGGGPVPVSVIRELAEEAFVKAVLHDGVDITTVAHYGRHMKAELRTALALGPAPDFDGVTCVEPGCDRRYGLEWDHVNPKANWGPTSYKNMAGR